VYVNSCAAASTGAHKIVMLLLYSLMHHIAICFICF
jgi:hypothetical protein